MDALAEFETACAHDREGREAEAVPHYERALDLGLPAAERRRALVGLGSSLRNVGRAAEAVAVLRRGLRDFPDDAALTVFLALALRSAGEEREAFATLGRLAVEAADLGGYERAAAFYLDELD